ncbi:MAG: polysaccharide pyruvyl transferase family protein [Desulfocapsaceae bacterium]|nr:polysaccharide pyruvyl transferase family protein [Desulfosporosinus sp.]MDR3629533.1 polysaccharide pyruvyl transferase family protein [Desulfocapsaceae bacterium]
MSAPRILIYGAIARQASAKESFPATWKRKIKEVRERLLWAVGSTHFLDYRNFNLPYPTNVGDIGIAVAVRMQLASRFPDAEFINLNWGELHLLEKKDPVGKLDLIVVAGGGYLFVDDQGCLAKRIEQDLLVLEHMATPVVLYGVGVNWLFNAITKENNYKLRNRDRRVLERIINCASLVSVRDPLSREILLENLKISVDLVCDPAIFLDLGDLNRQNTKSRTSTSPVNVSINFPFHGELSSTILRKNLIGYVQMLKQIRQDTNCRLHYFVHNYSELLIPKLLQDKGLDVEIVVGAPVYLFKQYHKMNIHIGGMLHSCIFAAGAGTPCVLLAYDIKHCGFADLFDMGDHCHDAVRFNSRAVLQSVRQILQNELLWRKKIGKRLAVLWRSQQQFIDLCAALGKNDICCTKN